MSKNSGTRTVLIGCCVIIGLVAVSGIPLDIAAALLIGATVAITAVGGK